MSDSRDQKSGAISSFLSIHLFGAAVLHLAGRTWLSFDSLEVREAKLTSNATIKHVNLAINQRIHTVQHYNVYNISLIQWTSMNYIIPTRFQLGDNQLFPLWIRLSQDPGLVSLLSSGCDALPRRVGSLRGVISAWNKSLTVVGVTQADRYGYIHLMNLHVFLVTMVKICRRYNDVIEGTIMWSVIPLLKSLNSSLTLTNTLPKSPTWLAECFESRFSRSRRTVWVSRASLGRTCLGTCINM